MLYSYENYASKVRLFQSFIIDLPAHMMTSTHVLGVWLLGGGSGIEHIATLEVSMLDALDSNINTTDHLLGVLSSCRHLSRLRLNGGIPIPIAPSIKMICTTLEHLNVRSVKV